jgi:hypothetical protein
MKKYFVRYFIEAPNAVGNRRNIENGNVFGWNFNFGSNEIGLYDHKQGLGVDCYVESESQLMAEEKSKTFVENVLNLIDFSTSSPSNSPLFISSYEATNRLLSRSFRQIFYIPIPDRNIKPINKEIFEEIFQKFNKNQDARIARAISWLRKGYLEQKFVDKFVAFWIGLESINELLCDSFQFPLEERKLKCDCGKEISKITSVGIKELFINEVGIDKSLFDKIRNARGKLLHGGGPLDNNFVNEIKGYNPTVRNTLIAGIGRLLQIDNKIIKNIIQQKPKVYNEKIRLIVNAELINFNPPKLEEFGKQPRLDLTNQNLLERAVDKNGKLNLKMKSNFICRNATFNITGIDLYGDENTAIESASFVDIK